jgi:hypothetical protein
MDANQNTLTDVVLVVEGGFPTENKVVAFLDELDTNKTLRDGLAVIRASPASPTSNATRSSPGRPWMDQERFPRD